MYNSTESTYKYLRYQHCFVAKASLVSGMWRASCCCTTQTRHSWSYESCLYLPVVCFKSKTVCMVDATDTNKTGQWGTLWFQHVNGKKQYLRLCNQHKANVKRTTFFPSCAQTTVALWEREKKNLVTCGVKINWQLLVLFQQCFICTKRHKIPVSLMKFVDTCEQWDLQKQFVLWCI